MKTLLRKIRWLAPVFDILLSPLTFLATVWFRIAKFWGIRSMPVTNTIFLQLGMIPIVDHYYEPLFDYRKLSRRPRELPGLVLDAEAQLGLLRKLTFQRELKQLPLRGDGTSHYYYGNDSFQSGDAEVYYSLIRYLKPKRIIEIGSGFSSLLALEAVKGNNSEGSPAELTCVEPYEMPWLESLPVKVIRKRAEELDTSFFNVLEENDILFVDSSHVIRPGGDVAFIILTLLPALQRGVWVHFHDIFTPADYPLKWLKDEYRLWNEQYLLEAYLSGNPDYEIKCALNFLKNTRWKELREILPVLADDPSREPGSFWICKSQ